MIHENSKINICEYIYIYIYVFLNIVNRHIDSFRFIYALAVKKSYLFLNIVL